MTIQINEVWNAQGQTKELARIEVPDSYSPYQAVWNWILVNRPDLHLAEGINDHGFHAKAVQ